MRSSSVPTPVAELLYAATAVLELPVIAARMLIAFVVATALCGLAGGSTAVSGELAYLGLIPTGLSLLALVSPRASGWWWQRMVGGRAPSAREREAYAEARALLEAEGRPLPRPDRWFVTDDPSLNAGVCANALMLSRGMLESPGLPAAMAHELGHLLNRDGRVMAALNLLVIRRPRRRGRPRPARIPVARAAESLVVIVSERPARATTTMGLLAWCVAKPLSFARGGLGLAIMEPLWHRYWCQRELGADAYAASLGQADELADFLEEHVLINGRSMLFEMLAERTHPPTRLRIDRLRARAGGSWP